MCSIFGVFDIKTDAAELRKKALELSRLMRHRGPDWSGIYACDNAILAHERLSIVDVNAGAQPLYNARKTHVLAVNGEIYNHQTLRAEYGDRYAFQTGSDCEVILALYQEKGPDFLDDLQGMFAFALYDSEKDAYLIGRDHIGIIPLYMGYDEFGNFYVASEMKALTPVCRTIKEFPAGSYLWSKDGEIRQYYQRDWFEFDAVKDNVTDKNALRQALEESVKSHLMSDVPYGVLLSGEGSDEVFGGYLYFHKAPNAKELHEETVRKLQALHMYDCARANKAMSAWGVEARVPFLDKKFLDVAMRINPQDKMCGNGKMEKHVLRECFESYLPASVAWRQKEQFSDGVGYSWIDTLKEVAAKQISDQQLETARFRFPYNTPSSKEAYLYREIFEELFPVPSAAECVPGGPSVACSSAKAIEWDEAFKTMDDPSGRAVGVHQSAYQ
ncbi:TPA: asparagine synthetase B [Salmonella enterica subsp. enterica serovar Typhimurium]|nr:asparagine synthetase B [Salmonella enterica subsp. enterica serovar Typhimurium]